MIGLPIFRFGGESMNIAVITGASAGIGRELVYAVDKDARYDEIWVIARRKERLEELHDKCTNPIRPIALDLSDLSSIDAYQALLEQEQPIHIHIDRVDETTRKITIG